MMGESSCSSQRFGSVEGTLCAVGKSLGLNSLSQDIGNSRQRPWCRWQASLGLLAMLIQSQCTIHNSLGGLDGRPLKMEFFFSLLKLCLWFQVTVEKGPSVLVREGGMLIKCLSSEAWESLSSWVLCMQTPELLCPGLLTFYGRTYNTGKWHGSLVHPRQSRKGPYRKCALWALAESCCRVKGMGRHNGLGQGAYQSPRWSSESPQG